MSPRWLCPGTAHLSSAAVLLELLCIPNCFWRLWSGLLVLNDKQPREARFYHHLTENFRRNLAYSFESKF